MQYARRICALMGAISLPMLVACSDDAMNSSVSSGNQTSATGGNSEEYSAESLIESATSVVANRRIVTEAVAVEDVMPEEYQEAGEQADNVPQMATAMLAPTQGNSVQGVVLFISDTETVVDELGEEQDVSRVRVVAEINGLAPGPHGFHIHANGDCSAADGSSAGGHFNPAEVAHGAPNAEERHAGDLGNITASAYGVSELDVTDPFLSFEGNNSILGKAVIVHAGQDDLSTQPSGNAGQRVACGVIEAGITGS